MGLENTFYSGFILKTDSSSWLFSVTHTSRLAKGVRSVLTCMPLLPLVGLKLTSIKMQGD
jgi:hypothetical protein